jgi:hypothetical protein
VWPDSFGRDGHVGNPSGRRPLAGLRMRPSSSTSFTLCAIWARRWIKCARANTPD